MYKQLLKEIDSLVIYADGKKLLEKTRDFNKLHRIDTAGVITSIYGDTITALNLNQEPKTARKENLNRKDNYIIAKRGKYSYEHTRYILYLHASEANVKELGEFVACEASGQKCYLYGYEVTFTNPADTELWKRDFLTVPGDWKSPIPWGKWINGERYRVSEGKTDYNVIHDTLVKSEEKTVYYTSETYHRIEKDEHRQKCEALAAEFNRITRTEKFSYYNIEDILKEYRIEKI